jgi:hypothetical protein
MHRLSMCYSIASGTTPVSNRLSLDDERRKIARAMAAPTMFTNFTRPHVVEHLPERPPKRRPNFNARRTDLNDNPLMLRLIRECISEQRPFSFFD